MDASVLLISIDRYTNNSINLLFNHSKYYTSFFQNCRVNVYPYYDLRCLNNINRKSKSPKF